MIAVVDDPPAIALFSSPHRLQFTSTSGKKLGQGPDMTGVGRIIRTAPGWLAAATDRQIVLCDLRRNTFNRLDVSLVQLTHLAIKPDEFGLALIQERDRIGSIDPRGPMGLEARTALNRGRPRDRPTGLRRGHHQRRPTAGL